MFSMKSYGYISVVFMFVWMGLAIAEPLEELTLTTMAASERISDLLPTDHGCQSIRYQTAVNVPALTGLWYVQTLLCETWDRTPLCDKVTIEADLKEIKLNWKSLGLLRDPALSSRAEYNTTLSVEAPGVWLDLEHGQNHPVYLVLSTWHPMYLVLAKCFPMIGFHNQDVYILSRHLEFYQMDLDLFIEQARAQGVQSNLNVHYQLWANCEKYTKQDNP